MNDGPIKIGEHTVDPESVALLPQMFCYSSSSIILGRVDLGDDGPIHVGMADPNNVGTLDTISQKFNPRRIIPVKLTPDEVTEALNKAFGMAPAAVAKQEAHEPISEDILANPGAVGKFDLRRDVDDAGDLFGYDDISRQEEKIPGAQTAVDLVNTLLLDAIGRGATDIHLENERRQVNVRIKLDGLLYSIRTPINKDNVEEVVNRLKVMSDLDISEHRAPQDGRVLLRTIRGGQDFDVPFRISILPGPYGEEVVLRVLDKSMAPISLELLGFTSTDLKIYLQMIKNPQGMILVTGPTGSGKTTTLYASLKEINSPHNKILSAEDPIEYNLDGVSQKQISIKFGFADMARAFLRHDPDILLIGEIRDEDTADVACKAAQTGHLILTTLHTNDSISAISRLHVLGLDYDLIASSILGVLSQRLVRRICDSCKMEYTPDEETLAPFRKYIRQSVFYKGAGCLRCNKTGYRGRIGVFELFVVDHEIQAMIYEEKSLDLILEKALRAGMRPLIIDGLKKVGQGLTTLEELHRVIPMRQIVMQLDSISTIGRERDRKGLEGDADGERRSSAS